MTAFNPIASGPLAASGGANYALNVTSGTFTLSMQGAAKLITDIYPSGTFSLSGSQLGLLVGENLFAENGEFTVTGHDVTTSLGNGIEALSGSFSLTGQDADFSLQRVLAADVGTFSLTGQDVPAILDISSIVDSTSFTLTGTDLDRLGANYDITANAGSFSATFQDADRIGANYAVALVEKAYAISGYDLKFRGFFSAVVPPETWTEGAPAASNTWTEAA